MFNLKFSLKLSLGCQYLILVFLMHYYKFFIHGRFSKSIVYPRMVNCSSRIETPLMQEISKDLNFPHFTGVSLKEVTDVLDTSFSGISELSASLGSVVITAVGNGVVTPDALLLSLCGLSIVCFSYALYIHLVNNGYIGNAQISQNTNDITTVSELNKTESTTSVIDLCKDTCIQCDFDFCCTDFNALINTDFNDLFYSHLEHNLDQLILLIQTLW